MYIWKRFVPHQQNETSSSRMTLNETNTPADSLSTVHLNASVGMRNYYIFYASGLEKLLSVCRGHVTPEMVPIQRYDRRTERNTSDETVVHFNCLSMIHFKTDHGNENCNASCFRRQTLYADMVVVRVAAVTSALTQQINDLQEDDGQTYCTLR